MFFGREEFSSWKQDFILPEDFEPHKLILDNYVDPIKIIPKEIEIWTRIPTRPTSSIHSKRQL